MCRWSSLPSDESLGYCHPSLRDENVSLVIPFPAMNRWAIVVRPCGTWARGRRALFHCINLAIVSTNPFTASTLFWNAARSASLSWTSMIRSTPPAPRITGTPT